MNYETLLIVSVVLYTAIIIGVGVWRTGFGQNGCEEYYAGGRSLGAWFAAFSGAASSESGWVLLGLVGTAYSSGFSTLWLIPGCFAGYLFNWFAVAPRLRRASLEHGMVTVPHILAVRGSERSKFVRLVAGMIVLVFMTIYVAAQFNAVGKSLNAMFEVPYEWGVGCGVVIVFAYLISGGFHASVWTDMLQASLMIVVLVIFPITAIATMGPVQIENLKNATGLFDITSQHTGFALAGFIIGWVGVGLAYPGQPQVLARFIAARDDRQIRRAGVIATVWSMLVFVGAIASGIAIRAWMPALDDAEQALPTFAVEYLSAPIAGLILAAVLAAICSTADSQLLVASASMDMDLLEKGERTEDSGKRRGTRTGLRSRIILVVLGSVAGIVAATENRIIFDFILYAWAALGASIGSAIIARLFWKRASPTGLVMGMVAGVGTVVLWKNVLGFSDYVYELVPAFALSLLLMRFVRPLPANTATALGPVHQAPRQHAGGL